MFVYPAVASCGKTTHGQERNVPQCQCAVTQYCQPLTAAQDRGPSTFYIRDHLTEPSINSILFENEASVRKIGVAHWRLTRAHKPTRKYKSKLPLSPCNRSVQIRMLLKCEDALPRNSQHYLKIYKLSQPQCHCNLQALARSRQEMKKVKHHRWMDPGIGPKHRRIPPVDGPDISMLHICSALHGHIWAGFELGCELFPM